MTIGSSRVATCSIETLFRAGATGSLDDGQLLELFLRRDGDEAEDAFAAIVERHGPMVWRACRRSLADHTDAEDAFQVTFLVLARKARSIAQRELLPNWLHGVAVRTAKEVKAKRARRRLREARWNMFRKAEINRMYRSDSGVAGAVESVDPWIDQELVRLPEIFRTVIVLCDLEGKTQEEAARQIGVPAGTIASRLARARQRLRRRLTRRGCTLSPAVVSAAFSRDCGVVPPALWARTIATGARLAAGGTMAGLVAPSLIGLAKAVTRTILATKLIVASALMVGLTALAAGSWAVATSRRVDEPGKPAARRDTPAALRPMLAELAWIDDLKNSDAATKERLKRCLSAALASYAAIQRAIYEFDYRQEIAALDRVGDVRSIEVRNYRGKVYWRDKFVRYDFTGPQPMPQHDPQGQPVQSAKKDYRFSVLRTPDTVTLAAEDLAGRRSILPADAPADLQLWKSRYPRHLAQIDPAIFYAKWFRTDEANFRTHCESLLSIQSAEGDRTIVLRLRREAQDARIEIICDKTADCLPTHLRTGTYVRGQWVTWAEESFEWRATDQVWFPVHFTSVGYVGPKFSPVKFTDLTVRSFRANNGVELADSILDPALLLQ